MSRSIYLINPRATVTSYYGAEIFALNGYPSTALYADLALATVAALIPDDFHITLCDEHITPIDFEHSADFVGLTGKSNQWDRIKAIATEFRRRGKKVIMGGSFVSLTPEVARGHCDVLVRGEIEEIAEELFADLRSGNFKEEYVGTRPDLQQSPMPRWDLYPNDRALIATVQTSRGCPFECEFCDVIQYLGRKQRHKRVDQVLAELDQVYAYGYRRVLLADDNFTVYRGFAKEMLAALRDWNARQKDGPVSFLTQLSVDAAKDDELLRLCAEARLTNALIGVETPNEEALRESRKWQNLSKNLRNKDDANPSLLDQLHRFVDYGIVPTAGMMVGFDSDGPDIFQRQYEFASASAIPIWSVVALVAMPATPLYDRLEKEGRLSDDTQHFEGYPWETNIIPRQLTREQLHEGLRWLTNELYKSDAFGERLLRAVERIGSRFPMPFAGKGILMRKVERDSMALMSRLRSMGKSEAKLLSTAFGLAFKKPQAAQAISLLLPYIQMRHVYETGNFWNAA